MRVLLFIFTLLLTSTSLQAEDNSWYTYWGVGSSKPYYSGNLKTIMDLSQETNLGAEHKIVNLDLYGFYWPLQNKKIIAGFIVNVVGDFLYHSTSKKVVGISQGSIGPSTMYFFESPQKGPFLRADLGISKFSVDRNVVYPEKPKRFDTGIGYGVLMGGGYAFAAFENASLLMNINYAIRVVGKDSVSTLSTTIGLLL